MKTNYVCEVCGKSFVNSIECRWHESNHYHGVEKIKYELIHAQEENICDYCKNSYYVYGCEQDCKYSKCSHSNNFKNFIPAEPFHNKRAHGGI